MFNNSVPGSEIGNAGGVEISFEQLLADILPVRSGCVDPGAPAGYCCVGLGIVIVIIDVVVGIASG